MPKVTQPIDANPGVSDLQAHAHGHTMLYFERGRGRGKKSGTVRNGLLGLEKTYTPGRMIRGKSVGMRKDIQNFR